MHSIHRRPKNPQKPFSFQGACRSRLRGRLQSLVKVPGDRIVRLAFASATLELRLTGRSGGLWLLQEGAVVATYDGPAPSALPEVAPRPPRDDDPRFEPVDGSWDLGARRFFAATERAHLARERRGMLQRRCRQILARNERLLENLQRDLERAEEAPLLRKRADLLAANLVSDEDIAQELSRLFREYTEEVLGFAAASWTTSEILEKLYRRAGRLDRVGDRVLERIIEVETEIARIARALRDLPSLDLEALRALEASLPAPVHSAGVSANQPWSTWLGPGGERVLVGRNERGNRRLTFQVARGNDWWMHVRSKPGSHLILPMQRDRTPPLAHLLAAAQIALVHARVPEGSAADVQYARVRDVRSIPGEVSKVRVADERVLRVTREAAELVGWARSDPA